MDSIPGFTDRGSTSSITHRFYGFEDDIIEVVLHEPRPPVRKVPEALLHDVWASMRFDHTKLKTTKGEKVSILTPGRYNTDSGPDFLKVRLSFGELSWLGDVEIHTSSKEWYEHGHHQDRRYNSVILHVTLYQDVWTGELTRPDGSIIPEIVLSEYLEEPVRRLIYGFYTRSRPEPVCSPQWDTIPQSLRMSWIQELAHERLLSKRDRLAETYLHVPDLEELLHRLVLAGLGYSKNTAAMATLAERIPLDITRRFSDPVDLEALHLGVAGFLPARVDKTHSDGFSIDYVSDLNHRFETLNRQLEIPAMPVTVWQFFRLRPANFPPLRIAQAVALLRKDLDSLFSRDPVGKIINSLRGKDPLTSLRGLLTAGTTPFWQTHVRLEKSGPYRSAYIGQSRIDELIINAVAPVMLLYADQVDAPALTETIIDLLKSMPAASDEITRRFTSLGLRVKDAFTAQGLHQLFRTRCAQLNCLSCALGQYLVNIG